MHVIGLFILVGVLLSGCAGSKGARHDIYGPGPKGYMIGKPYQVNGRWYYPAENQRYDEVGLASWYGPGFHGRRTANGEIYDRRRMTAAHTTLPMPVLVRVTNLENGRSTLVRVNDRGPFVPGRIIDLSEAAAEKLRFRHQGIVRVRVQYAGRADGRGPPVAAVQPAPQVDDLSSNATGALPEATEVNSQETPDPDSSGPDRFVLPPGFLPPPAAASSEPN